LDVVVATSAFGLGMDQGDVRSVVHATAPENVDRYYQEVGRGGRDGSASVALTVYTSQDMKLAERLNNTAIISLSRGLERWQQMFRSSRREGLGENRFRVPVDTVPSFRPEDIGMLNKYNLQWNVRTLTLMQRAGLLALDDEPPPQARADDLQPSTSPRVEGVSRVVRILDQAHLSEAAWRERVEPERDRSWIRDDRAFGLMREALAGHRRCLSEVFAEAYGALPPTENTAEGGATVERSCGGCTYCRERGIAPRGGLQPVPIWAWRAPGRLGPAISAVLQRRPVAVFYETGDEKRAIKMMWWLGSQGLRHVVVSDALMPTALEMLTGSRAREIAPFVTPFSEFTSLRSSALPTVLCISEELVRDDILEANMSSRFNMPRIVLLSAYARPADRPDRLLRNVISFTSYSLAEFETRLAL